MSEFDFRVLGPVIGVLVCILYYFYVSSLTKGVDVKRIAKFANKEVNKLGHYDDKLYNSIKYWVYDIAVTAYYRNKHDFIFELLFKWNAECNDDKTGLIYKSIEEAKTKFLNEIDKASQEEDETKHIPKFTTSKERDITLVSKTIMYSDYVDHEELLRRIEKYFV